MESNNSFSHEKETKRRLEECISRFKSTTEEELRRLRDQRGFDVKSAAATLVEKLRGDTSSVFVANPQDVKHVMALTGFQEVDAVRTLIVHDELTKLKNTGLEITAAIEELVNRATTDKKILVEEQKQEENKEEGTLQQNETEEGAEVHDEQEEEEEFSEFSDVYSEEEKDEKISIGKDEFMPAPQVKRRKRDSEDVSSSLVHLGATPSLENISSLNISDSSEGSTGIKKRLLQSGEHENPSKKKHKSLGITL